MLMTAGWLIFDTLTLLARSEGLTLILARITYVFVALSAVTWLVGALQYAGRTWWLAPSRLVLLLIIPTITILTIYTNDWYGLFWQTMTFVPAQHVLALDVSFGPWFWVHFVYSYICVGLGTFLITGESLAASRVYRQQATLVLIGILIPLIVNVIYVFHLISYPA
jgi:two-component system NtrC family sensor kinase